MISSFWWFLFWWGTKKPWKNRLWRWLCQSLLRGENEAIRWVRRNPGGGDCVDTKRRRGKSTSLWRYCGPSLMQIPPLDQVGKKSSLVSNFVVTERMILIALLFFKPKFQLSSRAIVTSYPYISDYSFCRRQNLLKIPNLKYLFKFSCENRCFGIPKYW